MNSVWLQRLAVATAALSLLPIGMGALVTTLGAGMAFPDWPTSDGQGMMSYPWHLSMGDKFVEHGHRLAGILIGLFSLALCATSWCLPTTKSVRIGCSVVLLAVVAQGALGGLRVLMNQTTLAFGHSVFGCVVFAGLWLVVLMQCQAWKDLEGAESASASLGRLAYLFPVIAVSQYSIGGVVRHFGKAIDIHLIGACAVVVVTATVAVVSGRSSSRFVRRLSYVVVAAMVFQIFIGIATWLTKYGLPELGLVAVQHSMWQVIARTLHTVVGMVFVASTVNWSLAVLKTARAKGVSKATVAVI